MKIPLRFLLLSAIFFVLSGTSYSQNSDLSHSEFNKAAVYKFASVKFESDTTFEPITPKFMRKNVVTFITKIGLMRLSKNEKYYFSSTLAANYELGRASFGGGVSYDVITGNHFIPIFADLKINFPVKNTMPFVFGDLGYSFATENGKGYMFNIGLGIKTKLDHNLNLIMDVGYKYQKYTYDITYSASSFKILGTLKYINANIGLQF